jgi:hypothetical protein
MLPLSGSKGYYQFETGFWGPCSLPLGWGIKKFLLSEVLQGTSMIHEHKQ